MVFEGILVDVLNRFLGPYVKNLDASQLKVGIWGGDVLLNTLELKENALDELDVPIRIFGGYLYKLRLKIPWKNLYSGPVIAEVDGLYVLAGPAAAAKYDAEKEAKEVKESKDKQLEKIEEARRKAAEDKDKAEQTDPGFVEKLVTQIVKNVQITVKNIHICYEDAVTNPSNPFSFGVTLDSLFVQSTGSDYKINGSSSSASDPVSALIYKVVQMNCLGVYWNSHVDMHGPNPPANWTDVLNGRISRPGEELSPDTHYIVRPITAEAKLQLTLKAGRDPNIPQALIMVMLEEVAVAIEKQQFHAAMSLVESLDRMSINKKYRKYKPSVSLREKPQEWWNYAITSVLEEDVKRRTRMWSWTHIREHRKRCREYTELYTKKLLAGKKVPADLKAKLEALEAKLDVLNITICRQRAETEASRERERQEVARSEQSWWGWATGWATGSGPAAETDFKPPSDKELAEERKKLYEAIGYSENAQLATYSAEYVAQRLNFDLQQVSLTLNNEEGRVAQLSTHQLHVEMVHRPASSNIGVKASVDRLEMIGRSSTEGKSEDAPVIITTEKEEADDHLLDVEFDLNPLKMKEDKQKIDQRIRLRLLPVQVVYDADTVDKIIDIFLLPKNVQLQKISAAAASTLEELKTQTRAGLEHSISQRKLLDIDIVLNSPRVIVPGNGRMTSSSSVLLADLGSLRVTSDMQFNIPDVRDASLADLQEAFYDHFNVSLTAVQLILAGAGDDWQSARREASSPYHILHPLGFDVQLKKSLLPNDTNLPSFIVTGKLPNISLDVSDKKLKQILMLVQSIPLPPPSLANRDETPSYSYEPEPVSMGVNGIIGSLSTSVLNTTEEAASIGTSVDREGGRRVANDLGVVKEEDEEEEWFTADEGVFDKQLGRWVVSPAMLEKIKRRKKEVAKSEVKSATKLKLQFDLDEICVNFSEHDKMFSSGESGIPRLSLVVSSVTAKVEQTTWNLRVTASMNSVTIKDYFNNNGGGGGGVVEGVEPELLLAAVAEDDQDMGRFLSVEYVKNERTAPHYQSMLQSTQQSISIELSLVRLRLQRESLSHLLAVAKSITAVLKKPAESSPSTEEPSVVKASPSSSESQAKGGVGLKPPRFEGEKDLSIRANLAGVEVTLADKHGELLTADTKELGATVDILEDRIDIKTSIKHVGLVDKEPGCRHPQVINEVEKEGEVIVAEVVVHQNPSKLDLDSSELSIGATVQRLQVTVLFRFLNRVKDFTTEFLSDLQLDEETIESARKAAAETAARTAEALKEQSSSRVKLNVTIHAPMVVLPLSSTSPTTPTQSAALVANLGSLTVTNKFYLAADVVRERHGSVSNPDGFLSPTRQPAIVDKMTITLTEIQFGRIERLAEEDITSIADDHMILKPLNFSGHVTRLLSGWCKEIPAIDVGADLEALDVQFSPQDFQAVMKLLDSLNDGKSQPEPPTKEEGTTPEPSSTEGEDKKDEEKKSEVIAEVGEEGQKVSNIHVAAKVGAVNLLLHSRNGHLAIVSVKKLCTDVDLKDDDITVRAGIGDIGVTDLAEETRYPQIVSVAEGARALDAVVGIYPKATKTAQGQLDMTKHDLSVAATLGQVKIVVLFLFINRLLSYLKQFNVSEDAIESARKSAQEGASAAVTAVQETHASGQRLKLDVSIQAPEITIPLKSDSNEVIVADLGSLSLSNTFHVAEKVDVPSDSGVKQQAAVYEKYNIALNNLQVFRSQVSDSQAPKQLIMEPFNFSTSLERNLSASWYRDIPTIKVDANFKKLKMVASGDDIEAVCHILSGNLMEGMSDKTEEKSHKERSEGKDVEEEQKRSESESNVKDESSEVQQNEEPFETLSVSATLESIEIELYKASPNRTLTDQRDSAASLAKLTLKKFEAGTKMVSNGEMTATVSMEDCLLDDGRPEKKNGITRLIERASDGNDSNFNQDPLIDFKLTKSETNNTTVEANVNNVKVLVDLPFILMLKDFAIESIKPLTSPPENNEMDESGDIEVEDAGLLPLSPTPASPTASETFSPVRSKEASPSTKSSEENLSQGRVTVSAKIKKPLIALLEDADDRKSRALVLSTDSVAFIMRSRGGNVNINSSIGKLLICSSTTDNLRNTAIKVLAPTSGPISASFDAFDKSGTEIDVHVPSLAFTFSPTTVRLILKVVNSLQPDSKETNMEIGETAPRDLWMPKPLDFSHWYFHRDDQPKILTLIEGSSVDIAKRDPTDTKSEFMRLHVEKVNIVVEQELPDGKTYPVVAMTLGKYKREAVEMNVQNWSGDLMAKAELTLEASYYNLSHDAWEPILEPVVDPDDESVYTPWTLQAEVHKRKALVRKERIESDSDKQRTSKDDDDLPAQMEILISSQTALQLTVTKTSLQILKGLMNAYQEDITMIKKELKDETDALAPEMQRAVFFITNELGKGTTVSVKPKATLKVHGGYLSKLQPGSRVPLHPVDEVPKVMPGELLPRSTHLKRAHIVTLELNMFKSVDVILGTSDLVYYPVIPVEATQKKKNSVTYGIVVEISKNVTDSIPLVTIRSPVKIMNHLDESVIVYWSEKGEAVSASQIGSVTKGQSLPVPFTCLHSPQGGFFLQPNLQNSGMSDQPIKLDKLDDPQVMELECYSKTRAVEGQSRCKAFYIHAGIKKEKYSKKAPVDLSNRSHHIISLHYPLVLQNMLPFPIEVTENSSSTEKRSLNPGELTHYSHITIINNPRFLTTLSYGGLNWNGEFKVNEKCRERTSFSVQPEKLSDSSSSASPGHQLLSGETHDLVVQKEVKGTWHLSIFSPYWMINKTSLILQYNGKHSNSIITHPPDMAIALFANEKTRVRVVVDEKKQLTTEWSDGFSLDAVGSEGIFKCEVPDTNHVYQLGSTVHMSGGASSKTVTLSPLFMAYNKTKDEISFRMDVPMEGDSVDEETGRHDTMITVPPNKLLPFWPQSGVSLMSLSINDSTMSQVTRPFKFTETASLLLRSDNTEIPAVVVDVQVTGSANIITFSPYYIGSVPLLLVNDTDFTIMLRQDSKKEQKSYPLLPYQTLFYTWDEPSDSHSLSWWFHTTKKEPSVHTISQKDGNGRFPFPKHLERGSTSSITSEGSGVAESSPEHVDAALKDIKEEEGSDLETAGEFDSSREIVLDGNPERGRTEPDFSISKTVKKFSVRTVGRVAKVIKQVSRSGPLRRKKRPTTGYWVSFQDGLQRTVLFTASKGVSDHVLMGNRTEQPSVDVTLSLIAVGLSLVNDVKGIEIAYIGIPQSALHWEIEKRSNRYKGVSRELNVELEKLYDEAKSEPKHDFTAVPNTELKVDFRNLDNMKLIEKGKAKKLRRLHMEGLRFELSVCEHSITMEAKLNEVQIDNQLRFSPNPTILYSYPPPPELASKFAPKPFIDTMIILRRSEHSTEIQLLQVLIQEMGVNIDLNFVLAIAGLFGGLPNMQTDAEIISEDIEYADKQLVETKLAQVTAASSRIYFNFLHLSPLDIHLSFSLDRDPELDEESKAESEGNIIIRGILSILNHFASIIGSAKDAELKLGYFQLENVALTNNALVDRITKHYVQQALLQVYKILFGLEMLGNPVGFVTGLKDGAVGLFYYPIQGAVLGPGEFFQGLALGGQQFFAGTIGGVSGALGRITGALAKTTTKLTLDEDFQEERKRAGAKGIGQGLEGAAKGVWAGVSGLVTQPIKGARKRGILGVFTGLGKGAVGLFLRPATGLLDLTSATLTVVQKKTQIGDYEVEQIRTARYIGPEKIVYPFSPHMSTGNALFLNYDSGRLVDTDIFFDYVELVEEPLKALLITNKRFAMIRYSAVRGKWDDDLIFSFQNLDKPTTFKGSVITMDIWEEGIGFGFLGGGRKKDTKTLTVRTPKLAECTSTLINQAFEEYRTTVQRFEQ